MTVYDVVHIVQSGPTSYLPGRWYVEHWPTEEQADRAVARYNECRMSDCHRYVVEAHDELSPDRAPCYGHTPESSPQREELCLFSV